MDNHRSSNHGVTWYTVLALAVLLLGLAGYVGYLVYPRFDLPAVSGGGLLVLAGAAGIASFFSPCAFPLLLTLLGRETGPRQGKSQGGLSRALGFAFALSIGAGTFLLLTGTVIALGGGALFAEVTFVSPTGRIIRLVVGTTLIFLGLIQLGKVPVSFHGVEELAQPILATQAELRRRTPYVSFAIFGFGYWIAGFG